MRMRQLLMAALAALGMSVFGHAASAGPVTEGVSAAVDASVTGHSDNAFTLVHGGGGGSHGGGHFGGGGFHGYHGGRGWHGGRYHGRRGGRGYWYGGYDCDVFAYNPYYCGW
jgi:hypothetical protein